MLPGNEEAGTSVGTAAEPTATHNQGGNRFPLARNTQPSAGLWNAFHCNKGIPHIKETGV